MAKEESSLSQEIAKLTEKIAKDPSSKLFVPLAEEYRKSGMLDEAIEVLMEGLKVNPSYTTARVALGKMLLEKGSIKEAQAEFENVVAAVPDNLFAHKKLADIYQSSGDIENLLKEYKIITLLSPEDEDAKKALHELEGRITPKPEEVEEPAVVEEVLEAGPEIPLEEFPSATELGPLAEEEADKGSLKEEEVLAEEVSISETEVTQEEVVYELPEEIISPEDLGIEMPLRMTPVIEHPPTKEMEELKAAMEMPLKAEREKIATETLAEMYIKQGMYEKADEIYQQMLSSQPDNMAIHQRREELNFLINLIKVKKKRSPNILKIERLEAWLKNIKERRG